MSRELWAQSIPTAIDKLESGKPNEDNAVILAALYALQDKFSGDDTLHSIEYKRTAQSGFEAMQNEPTKADIILNDLHHAFADYSESKAAHMIRSSDNNYDLCLKDLDNILNGSKQLFALIIQSASTKEEKTHIKAFFMPYMEKFFKYAD